MKKEVKITTATDGVHKKKAVFSVDNKKVKTTQFGAKGYSDYISYYRSNPAEAEKHKTAYLTRHKATENWSDPKSAGALSRWILWNKPTLPASIADYKKKFGFK